MYSEIIKLREDLIAADIPFEFEELHGGYHIEYPNKHHGCLCSVVQHDFSYGGNIERLEIMGLLTEEELRNDEVVGYKTADDVFLRIKRHWEGN